MCGRFAQTTPPRAFAERYGVDPVLALPNVPARYNIAPTQNALVIRHNPQEERRELSLLRWGLVPSFAADTARAGSLINARSESVAEKASFKAAWFKPRRCVVPADAFYEWQQGAGGKTPHAIARADGTPMAFAGLWEGWKDPASGQWLRTFTLLTTTANDLLRPLHERMPVILDEDQIGAYLTAPDPRDLLRPYPAEAMRLWPVSARVNAVRNDDADLLVEVTGLPAGSPSPVAQPSLF